MSKKRLWVLAGGIGATILVVASVVLALLRETNHISAVSTTTSAESISNSTKSLTAAIGSGSVSTSTGNSEKSSATDDKNGSSVPTFYTSSTNSVATPSASQTSFSPNKTTSTTRGTTPTTENGSFDITTLTYEMYINMDGARQREIIDMFSSPRDFVKWYNAAKAKYEAEHPDIEIGDDVIDLGGLT